ncbi:MAG: hypothetical protein DCF19_16190 [Pseudanabaena frigida]|uniref:General stress protein 17M-like domain-containing protein n=1 Tax=Pseudanabaena frigida TaxID=945775 RepID=A0A2W4VZZ4_9CYAN|nr:MAG: hypothetical protein DCF19_16190 [Pseudanabaena frigida]
MATPTEQTAVPIDQINQASGHTVDGEGLLNNYAIEPEMYEEDGGVVSELGSDRVTVVDIFNSEIEAKNAILEMEKKGLRSDQISVIAKDYEESESSMNWQKIAAGGGLAVVLKELGISNHAASQFVEAIDAGKFLVIEIGSDRQASQVQHILEKAGHSLQNS